jgi:hypothetical protein
MRYVFPRNSNGVVKSTAVFSTAFELRGADVPFFHAWKKMMGGNELGVFIFYFFKCSTNEV